MVRRHDGEAITAPNEVVLGRETAIQKVEWTDDGWLRMADGTNIAKYLLLVCLPTVSKENPRCDFDSPTLDLHFCTPRNEITPDWQI